MQVRTPDSCSIYQLKSNVCRVYIPNHLTVYIPKGNFDVDQKVVCLPHDTSRMMSTPGSPSRRSSCNLFHQYDTQSGLFNDVSLFITLHFPGLNFIDQLSDKCCTLSSFLCNISQFLLLCFSFIDLASSANIFRYDSASFGKPFT